MDTHTVHLADGRALAWTEAGEHSGSPVFSFHGLPGSRFQRHPDGGIARSRGLRLIHVERPGFGLSSPRPGRTLAEWPRDVAALADALGIGRFAVLGISGGGPFALACASLLPERVSACVTLGGVTDMGWPGAWDGYSEIERHLMRLSEEEAIVYVNAILRLASAAQRL